MREKEIKEILADEIRKRQIQAKERMKENYEAHKETYINTFVNLIDLKFKECIEMQRSEGEIYVPDYEKREFKGRIKYIRVSYMRSSAEDKTYEYLVRMYDDKGYSDRFEIEGRFYAAYRKDCIEEDREYFTNLIMKKVVRAKKYEVKDFIRSYVVDTYIKPVPYEVKDSPGKIMELDSYRKLQKDEKLSVTYGQLYNKYYSKYLLYMDCEMG